MSSSRTLEFARDKKVAGTTEAVLVCLGVSHLPIFLCFSNSIVGGAAKYYSFPSNPRIGDRGNLCPLIRPREELKCFEKNSAALNTDKA